MVRNEIADFMNAVIYEKKWFFLNYWSFAHLLAGFFTMFILIKYFKIKSKISGLLILLGLLSVFEVFEYVVALKSNELLFRLDPLKDTISDLVYGMASGIVCAFTLKKEL